MKTTVTMRDVGDVKIIELHGKITIGAGDLQMREAIHAAVNGGATKILVDMKDVTTIDSSGVGELVGCYTTATHKGAKLKLAEPPAEDQRRPHGDAAHHRVRRLHEREGRAGELLMSRRRGASSPVTTWPRLRVLALRVCSARCASPWTRAFRPSSRRRTGEPDPLDPLPSAVARSAALAREARAAGARRPRGRAVRRRRAPRSSTRAARSRWSTRRRSSSTTCPRWTTRRLRRGRPALHVAHGESIAILAAVTLLVARVRDSRRGGPPPAARRRAPASAALDLVSRLADASGLLGLASGQALDLTTERLRRDVRPPRDDPRAQDGRALRRVGRVRRRARRRAREGARGACARTRATSASRSRSWTTSSRRTADAAETGKSARRAPAPTFVRHVGAKGARTLVAELTQHALDSLKPFGKKADLLREFAVMLRDRKK